MSNGKKTVLITGASDGIGLALARKLLDAGYVVIGTSRSGVIEKLEHEDFKLIPLEMTDEASVDTAHKLIKQSTEKIDILINNAGVGMDLGKSVPEKVTFTHTFNTNVTGLVFFTEPLLDLMKNGGQVINISSQLGSLNLMPHIYSTAYRMSKAAINMYTRVLAERLREKRITVISVHPGWVQTKLATKGAPLTPQISADRIYEIIIGNKPTSSFWNAETGRELPW